MKEQTLVIPDGYFIEEKKQHFHIGDAVAFLSGRAQTRVTLAQKHHEGAVIASHHIVCPHCRKTLPAYGRFLHKIFHTHGPIPAKLSPDAVEAWGGAQACLWQDAADTLVFNSVYSPQGSYTCPHCFQKSMPARESTEVTITEERRKVSISCYCTDIGDLLRLPWKLRPITQKVFPFRECVTFNFATGKTYISAADHQAHIFAARNISGPGDWAYSKIHQLILQNSLVRRRLKQSFRKHWGTELPFAERELTPGLLVKLTAYIGYPADFFSRIPAAEDYYCVEKSFRRISKQIHTPKQLCGAITRSQLPQSKSLRKILYSTPDLVFYLAEIELLAEWFCDVNVLRTLLKCPFTYPLLSFLHIYRSADLGPFFTDFVQQKGFRALIERLKKKHEEVLLYALQYSGLSPSRRNAERKKWTAGKHIQCLPALPYALPMRNTSIPDSKVDSFDFRQLRSKAEYLKAAKELRNCLGKWGENDNPVVVIQHRNTILGAIEIEGQNRIVQVRGKNNLSLPEKCLPAYDSWKEKFRLIEGDRTLQEDCDDEDYNPSMFTYLNCRWF